MDTEYKFRLAADAIVIMLKRIELSGMAGHNDEIVKARITGETALKQINKKEEKSMLDLLSIGCNYFGLKEIKGSEKNNPEILEMFAYIGYEWVQTDETAWCSAFINYLAKKLGYEYSGKLDARSWLKVGYETNGPVPGDIVVLWRDNPESWKGHVGLYVNSDDTYVYVLGGNQSNQVKISAYPIDRVLSYRKLRKV